MKIYLVRHGETEWNKEGKLQGQSDIPLNEYGRELAQITAEGLRDIPFDAVYCSPLIRAKETAEIIKGDRKIPIYFDQRIKEISFGVEEGANLQEIKKNEKDPLYNFIHHTEKYIPPEKGESFKELYKRSAEFMKEVLIPAQKKYETLLLVAHGALNRSILNQIAGIPIDRFWEIQLKNCCVSVLSLQAEQFKILEKGKLFYEG